MATKKSTHKVTNKADADREEILAEVRKEHAKTVKGSAKKPDGVHVTPTRAAGPPEMDAKAVTTVKTETVKAKTVTPKVKKLGKAVPKGKTAKTFKVNPPAVEADEDFDLVLDLDEPKVKTSKKAVKETQVKKGPTQKQLLEKYPATKTLGRAPKPSDYKWEVHPDWADEGVYRSRDPMAHFKDFPAEYVTDPISKTLLLTRAEGHDKYCMTDDEGHKVELMFLVDRRSWIKSEKKAGHEVPKCLPREYYGIMSERRFVIATSFGQRGSRPADLTK